MRRAASVGTLAIVIAVVAAPAPAAGPNGDPYGSLAGATHSLIESLKHAGVRGLLRTKKISFDVPAGAAGGIRVIVKFGDIRPHHIPRPRVASQVLQLFTAPTTITGNVRLLGRAILASAQAHHKAVSAEMIVHIRPTGASESIETFSRVSFK
jgi:hypothetical protein